MSDDHSLRTRLTRTMRARSAICVLSLSVLPLASAAGSRAFEKSVGLQETPDALYDLAQPVGPNDQRPALIVDGTAVMWDDLRPALSEAAGGEVVREFVLDARLATEARARGIVISDEDLRRERSALTATAIASGVTADQAALGLDAERKARGLGERRFAALIRRTATLRALVRDRVQVTEAMVKQAFETRYGERVRLRLIMLPDLVRAEDLRHELVDEAGACSATRFGEAAVAYSSDASAPAGGLIEPLSVVDTRYPVALRSEAAKLALGHVSRPVAMDKGVALVYLDSKLPALSVTLDEVKGELEGQLRQGLERVAMDEQVQELLRSVPLTIMDRSLQWSWEASGGNRPAATPRGR